jgi:ribosomal-protein-alanine N-acetyltransferase
LQDSPASSPNIDRLRIRRVESSDLHDVIAINRKSFVLPYSAMVFREFFNEHRYAFIVAESDGRIAGYAMSRILRKLNLKGLGVKKIGHIMSIAVHPDFRRRGIGKLLLERTVGALTQNDATELRLEVRTGNQLAIDIYLGMGFHKERTIDGYYSDGEDAILMTKRLDG